MQLFRLAIGVGMIGLGAVAAFMGLSVLLVSLSNDSISYRYARDGSEVANTIDRATDPSGYWSGVGMLGGLPSVLGLFAVWYGRRILKG